MSLRGTLVLSMASIWIAITPVRSQQAGLTGATRDKFVAGAIRTCTEGLKQASTPQNEKIPDGPLNSYCACYANDVADRISDSVLRSLSNLPNNEERLAAMKPVTDAALEVCMPAFEKALR
jgi:hypothetical protein